MESGEKELRKAFEEVTTNNVRSTIEHSNQSRKIIRTLEDKVIKLDELVRSQNETIELIQKQISYLQQKIFKGGTT